MLIGAGAAIDSVTDNIVTGGQLTPLFIAAARGHEAVLAMLIKAGADVNRSNDDGCTPLIIAAAHGHEAVLVALLKAGAPMTVTNGGCMPLMAATNGGHTSVVAALRRWIAGIRD